MSQLALVATPIGNLEDLSARALRILKEADSIVCEDTRKTSKLLAHYHIEKKLISLHQHSTESARERVVSLLLQGKSLAYVTDSGTPGISDPGNLLIRDIRDRRLNNVTITPIPGPCALTALASVSGFSTDRFLFLGFIPHKKGKQTMLRQIADSKIAVIFYESPHRIQKTLTQLAELISPTRKLLVGREMTKMFETFYFGTVREIIDTLKQEIHGEFAIIVEGEK